MGLISSVISGLAEGATQIGFGIYDRYNQNKWAERNEQLQREAMAQTQYNFENQAQIRTADYMKAGLSPLAVNGVQGQSISASPSSPSSSASPSLGVAQILSEHALQEKQLKNDLKMQREQIKHEEKMQAEQLATNISINNSQLEQQNKQFQDRLIQDYNIWSGEFNEKQREFNLQNAIQKQLAAVAEREVSAKEAANVIAEAKKNNEFMIAMQQIDQANRELEQAKSLKEKELALQKRSQNISLASSIISSVVHAAGIVGGFLIGRGKTSSNPIGFHP